MNKVLILIIGFFVLALSMFILMPHEESEIKEESNIILFYSEYCSHCLAVKEYIQENKIEDKISFETKDANQNTELLFEKASICGIDPNHVGVPFLFDGEKCILGDEDIIDFFESKINLFK